VRKQTAGYRGAQGDKHEAGHPKKLAEAYERIELIDASVQSTPYLDPRGLVELFESDFEVFDDILGENVGIGKIVGVFQTSFRSQNISRLALSRLMSSSRSYKSRRVVKRLRTLYLPYGLTPHVFNSTVNEAQVSSNK
jgi:hypothetical protein